MVSRENTLAGDMILDKVLHLSEPVSLLAK